jgi:glucose/arabinose dehydrogenase
VRNPWRFSFDRSTGDFYLGEVGQNRWEEIDYAPIGQGGKNYGWSKMEGLHCFPPSATGCNQPGFTPPIAEYVHPVDKGSVTGGYVYRGQDIPCLRGRYLYGDYEFSTVYSLVVVDGKATSQVELTSDLVTSSTSISGLSSFGEDARGELYLLSYNNRRIYRIDAE